MHEPQTRQIFQPPPIPDKWEITPIHTSDRAVFKRCRRKWHFSSPMRMNLQQDVRQYGVYPPLWFGTGIHYALEQYYNPILSRDPVEAFRTWFHLQWFGGQINHTDLRLSVDRNPQPLASDSARYEVKGLNELHPDPDEDEFMGYLELGVGMMEFYKSYAEKNDNFDVIMVEHDFSIPLGWFANDPRDGELKPVHYRGRMDVIVQDRDTGEYWIRDYKTATRTEAEGYFEKLEKDEQCTSYLWAGEQEAKLNEFPYDKIAGIEYVVLWKGFPGPPTMTSKGFPLSLNRQSENTTADLFMEALKEMGCEMLLETNDKAVAYVDWLKDLGDDHYVTVRKVYRNRHEIESADWRIKAEATEMLNIHPDLFLEDGGPNQALYPNFTADYSCLRCPFRGPCIAMDDGANWKDFMDMYVKASDR